MRLYLAGPMTGYPQFNIPAFDALAAELRALEVVPELGGIMEVISPAEMDDEETRAISLASPDGAIATLETHGLTWGDFIARDVKMLADEDINAVVVLPGWEKSPGALVETFIAFRKHLPIVTYANGSFTTVALLDLARAWTAEEDLIIARSGYGPPVR